MSYTRIELGALLLQNKDGSAKKEPTVFRPRNREPTLTIPPYPLDHARPIVRLTSEDYPSVTLMFYPDKVIAVQNGKTKTLVTFDFDDF